MGTSVTSALMLDPQSKRVMRVELFHEVWEAKLCLSAGYESFIYMLDV